MKMNRLDFNEFLDPREYVHDLVTRGEVDERIVRWANTLPSPGEPEDEWRRGELGLVLGLYAGSSVAVLVDDVGNVISIGVASADPQGLQSNEKGLKIAIKRALEGKMITSPEYMVRVTEEEDNE